MKSIKKLIFAVIFTATIHHANAQINSALIQVGGLTCSMCSFSTEKAIRTLPFIKDVKANLEKAEYELTFKPEVEINLDQIAEKVTGAGFSVIKLVVSTQFDNLTITENEHVTLGKNNYHFMNVSDKVLDGTIKIQYLDRNFLSPKEFKKLSAKSTFACFQTGKKESCCKDSKGSYSRIFHVTLI